MFGGPIGQLAAAVDALDELGDRLSPDELAALFGLRSRLEARLCRAVAVFHAAGDGALDGAVSTRAWLLWRARLSGAEAARMIRAPACTGSPRSPTRWRPDGCRSPRPTPCSAPSGRAWGRSPGTPGWWSTPSAG